MLLLSVAELQAVPARKGLKKQIKLDNGKTVTAELRGDEFFSYYDAGNGNRYVLNAENGLFGDKDFEKFSERGKVKRDFANRSRVDQASAKRRKANSLGGSHTTYTGKKKGLIILVNFQNKTFKFGHNQAFFNRMANETGFSNNSGFVGSIKDYFLAQSNGQFELDFDVVGPYRLPHPYAYYGAHSSEGGNDVRPGTMVRDAVQLADKDVDYTQYDWDGDGYVDQVYVLYAGLGEAAGGDNNTIWPHEWNLSSSEVSQPYRTADGVSVDKYACGCEQTLNRLGNEQINGIGTLCHEFSHCLGLPDLYDTNYQNFGMGAWDLLDQGSYNDADGTHLMGMCPPNYSAYEKWYCGWITPTTLDGPTSVKGLQAQHDKYGQVFVVYNDKHTDECYLLENRRNDNGDTWDQSLAASGLMIQHVDYNDTIWNYNIVNNTSGSTANYFHHDHQSLTIFHADNSDSNYAGDLYPYNGNNSLTDTSVPAAIIYHGGSFMGKPITNITKNDDGTISFDFMGGSSSNVVDGINGIYTTNNNVKPAGIYGLDGRYYGNDATDVPRGVYIINGKKYIKR